MNKIKVRIKDSKIMTDDGINRHTYTFNSHLDLKYTVENYWMNVFIKYNAMILENRLNNIDNTELNKIVRYKEKIRDKMLIALDKVSNNNKSIAITIKEM